MNNDTTIFDLRLLIAWSFYLVAVFGLRTLVHRRRTGSSGFVGISGAPFSLPWWGGALMIVALAIGSEEAARSAFVDTRPTGLFVLFGWTVFAAGAALTLIAQFSMGNSWRIGVDPSARTELVHGGVFRFVRNPIFSAMLLTGLGLLLLLPTWLTTVAWLALLAGLEIQVRYVEEPYLIRTHGSAYASYARETGRFVPGVGRLRA